jgi:hypothetical protein
LTALRLASRLLFESKRFILDISADKTMHVLWFESERDWQRNPAYSVQNTELLVAWFLERSWNPERGEAWNVPLCATPFRCSFNEAENETGDNRALDRRYGTFYG